MDVNAKLEDIKVWYKFRPTFEIWTSKSKGKSAVFFLYDETWYGGKIFKKGIFSFIQLRFIAVHMRLDWWKIKLI